MKHVLKIFSSAMLVVVCLALAACSGIPGGNNGGGGGGSTGPFTISVSVTGLAGTGLTLTNNVTDKLTITGSGTFKFATTIAKGAVYAVAVTSQPVNPGQICVIPQGATGTATANITLNMTCTTGAFSIGGNVNTLQGSGLILQNVTAGGTEKLPITGNGSFTFVNPVATNGTYSVTVLSQPTNPTQTCTLQNANGTATGNVGNIVVTCSVGTIPIGGSVVGLDGTGLTLLDNGGDSLVITGNGVFSFPTLLVSGATYNVTISKQPSGPSQTCTVQSNGTGPVTAPAVTNVLINCPPIFETIGGQTVGLSIPNGFTSKNVLQDNAGDNLPISGNGPFQFQTQIAYGSAYDVTALVGTGTQAEPCIIWGFQGKAITPVTDVTNDCGHNDWAWINGANTGNNNGAYATISFPLTSFNTNSPGGRKFASSWTDQFGNLWLFGGWGYTYNTSVGPQPFFLNEMWVYNGATDYGGGIFDFWNLATPLPAPAPPQFNPSARWGAVSWTNPNGKLMLFGGQRYDLSFMNDFYDFTVAQNGVQPLLFSGIWTSHAVGGANVSGVYGTLGTGSTSNLPGGRWAATATEDASGNVWLFGGFGYDEASAIPGLLNDLWTYNTATGAWTWVAGSKVINQDGVYGTVGTAGGGPGGRQNAVSWVDNAGNFWIFGGYNLAADGTPNAFNDLWKYSGGQWTWVSGASSVNQLGNYGTIGVSDAANVPGARWAPAAWTDAQGIFWMYGGQGYDPAGNGSLADLWAYNPNAAVNPPDPNPFLPAPGQWMWVKGPISVGQPGQYGLNPAQEFGTTWPHVTNNASSRYGSTTWTQHFTAIPYPPRTQMFLFGGEGFDSTTTNGNFLLNDLQRYVPYP